LYCPFLISTMECFWTSSQTSWKPSLHYSENTNRYIIWKPAQRLCIYYALCESVAGIQYKSLKVPLICVNKYTLSFTMLKSTRSLSQPNNTWVYFHVTCSKLQGRVWPGSVCQSVRDASGLNLTPLKSTVAYVAQNGEVLLGHLGEVLQENFWWDLICPTV
jgi:hypothetical protein